MYKRGGSGWNWSKGVSAAVILMKSLIRIKAGHSCRRFESCPVPDETDDAGGRLILVSMALADYFVLSRNDP